MEVEAFDDIQIDNIFNYLSAIPNGKLYACMFALGLTTGSRINEILTVKRKHLIVNGDLVDSFEIFKSKTKKKKTRKVHIVERFKPIIYDWLIAQEQKGIDGDDDFVCSLKKNKPIYPKAFYRKIKSAGKFFNFKGNYGTHSMRQTHARIMREYYRKLYPDDALKQLLLLQEALGHAEIKSTTHYTKEKQPHYQNNHVNDAFK